MADGLYGCAAVPRVRVDTEQKARASEAAGKVMNQELKPGDTVVPRRGRGGPWVIASIGSQSLLFGDGNEKVVHFKDGTFIEANKVKKVDASQA